MELSWKKVITRRLIITGGVTLSVCWYQFDEKSHVFVFYFNEPGKVQTLGENDKCTQMALQPLRVVNMFLFYQCNRQPGQEKAQSQSCHYRRKAITQSLSCHCRRQSRQATNQSMPCHYRRKLITQSQLYHCRRKAITQSTPCRCKIKAITQTSSYCGKTATIQSTPSHCRR